MNKQRSRVKQARILRIFRKIHRTMGAFLFVFFFIVSVSGILLGAKKNTSGYILPETQSGQTSNFEEWKSIAVLENIAQQTLKDSVSSSLSSDIDRMDIRKEKGIVKFLFENHIHEIQLDGSTGDVLSIGQRRSDVIENIHDGSIVDDYLGTGGYFKLIYSVSMGIALLVFTITGFWLWYGPKKLRKTGR